MVRVTIHDRALDVEMDGMDKLWTQRNHLIVPLANVRRIRRDETETRRWSNSLRIPGTGAPGVIEAGTFYLGLNRVFYDVHRTDHAVIIDLVHERYDELVVEVADPQAVIRDVQAALEGSGVS